MGEDAALHPALLAAAVEHLPPGKPRLLLGMVRQRARARGAALREGRAAPHAPPMRRACAAHAPPCPPPRAQSTPEEAIAGVLAGADLFDCSYPTHATANGYALAFPTRMPPGWRGGSGDEAAAADAGGGAEAAGAEEGGDDSKINLWAQQYRRARGAGRCGACAAPRPPAASTASRAAPPTRHTRARPRARLDKRALVPGCACFACKNHTRAYMHHLLHANEMLAFVLLETHNTHWWLDFFEGLREAVVAGRAAEYGEWFAARRRGARAAAAAAP